MAERIDFTVVIREGLGGFRVLEAGSEAPLSACPALPTDRRFVNSMDPVRDLRATAFETLWDEAAARGWLWCGPAGS